MQYLHPTGDRQRIISKPEDPTRVFIGQNVSLAWRYYQPKHVTLSEVVFGIWNTFNHLNPKLIAVNGSGFPEVKEGYESFVSWAGNLTGFLAVFVLHDVHPADGNKFFGITFKFGLMHNVVTDRIRLQVVAKRKSHQISSSEFLLASSHQVTFISTSGTTRSFNDRGVHQALGLIAREKFETGVGTLLTSLGIYIRIHIHIHTLLNLPDGDFQNNNYKVRIYNYLNYFKYKSQLKDNQLITISVDYITTHQFYISYILKISL